jgi:hypothetical protein
MHSWLLLKLSEELIPEVSPLFVDKDEENIPIYRFPQE